MARRPRIQFPDAVYHVMARGNRKAPVFDDDEDRRRFLAVIRQAAIRYDTACFAFCLMGNHYHLVLDTPRGNLSHAMRHVNGVYTQASNRRHGRTGHLFEGRFRSIVVESESYLRDLARYVVLNPVRAGLAGDAAAWAWSSYRATAGLELPPSFLNIDWITWAFGGASLREAQARYALFVNQTPAKDLTVDLETLALGTPSFERALRGAVLADDVDRRLPRAHRALARPTLQGLFGAPAQSRGDRNRLIRVAHVRYGYRLIEIAMFLGVHPGTPSKIVRRLEAAEGRQQVSPLDKGVLDMG